MDSFLVGATSALWLGILTSISPCPLATNIAAISFIGKHVGSPRMIFLSGLLYMIGRIFSYTVLGIILIAGFISVFDVSDLLQQYLNIILGPLLIIVGLFLLEFIRIGSFGLGVNEKFQNRAGNFGIWGAGLLGIVFALSFCPISAALFFGSLIPLATKFGPGITLPSLYGLGTGLPVIIFAFLLAFGTRFVGRAFDMLKHFELWARRLTGIIFILVGIYYSLVYIFKVAI